MIIAFITLLISYIICVIYVKRKMKADSESILKKIKEEVDLKNLDNLIKFSEKKQNPESYNSNIIEYQEEIAIYTGQRVLASPKETFEDFFLMLNRLLTI